jgi:hypothetical protein
MTSNGRLMAKCAFAAAVVTGLFAATQLSERKTVASWAPTAAPASAAKPAQAAAVPITEQRLTSTEQSCAAQVWPNISKDCITGRVELERREARPVAQPQLAALPPTPAPGARASGASDPATTGALPVAATPAVAAPGEEAGVQAAPTAPRPRDVHRPRRPASRATAAERAPPSSSDRVREPIHFRLAEGRN